MQHGSKEWIYYISMPNLAIPNSFLGQLVLLKKTTNSSFHDRIGWVLSPVWRFVPSVDFAFIGDFKYPCQRTLNTFSCIPKYPILMKHVPGTHFLQSSPRDLFSKSLSGNMMSGTIEVRAGRAQMFQLHAVKKLGQILQVLSPPCQKYH